MAIECEAPAEIERKVRRNDMLNRLACNAANSGCIRGPPDIEASLKPTSIVRFLNAGTVFEASLRPASIGLQTRFPNTGTVFEASLKLKYDSQILGLGRCLKLRGLGIFKI